MMEFPIERMLPGFLLKDKNGIAMAAVLDYLMGYMAATVEKALAEFSDADVMPEWRLDEMAWEYGCLYDFNADVSAKRKWIKDVQKMTMIQGTVEGIRQYLVGYFSGVDIEEWWQYGGEPYHFRMSVAGELTPENYAWLVKATDRAKNARSVLDSVMINGTVQTISITSDSDVLGSTVYPRTGAVICGGSMI